MFCMIFIEGNVGVYIEVGFVIYEFVFVLFVGFYKVWFE